MNQYILAPAHMYFPKKRVCVSDRNGKESPGLVMTPVASLEMQGEWVRRSLSGGSASPSWIRRGSDSLCRHPSPSSCPPAVDEHIQRVDESQRGENSQGHVQLRGGTQMRRWCTGVRARWTVSGAQGKVVLQRPPGQALMIHALSPQRG